MCDCTRRDVLKAALGGFAGLSMHHRFFSSLFAQDAAARARARACIVLWMDGGPSQIDTFDPKPGRETGGEFKSIPTASKEFEICEHLPRLAKAADKFSIVRSVHTEENDHVRGAYLLHTGYRLQGSIDHPSLGSMISFETAQNPHLPNYVSIRSDLAFLNVQGAGLGPGFLGHEHSPFVIDDPLKPSDSISVLDRATERRMGLLADLDRTFHEQRRSADLEKRKAQIAQAAGLRETPFVQALDLSGESASTIEAYTGGAKGTINYFGRQVAANQFGYGCLVARRLVERGVRFVEVNLGGWDTHANNFVALKPLLGVLDSGMSALLADLDRTGLLSSTLVLWMGEFGRTPVINGGKGRDHYNQAFSVALAGGTIQGGRVVGRTDEDGKEIVKDPVGVPDVFATVCAAFGIDPAKKHFTHETGVVKMTENGRPIRGLF
jgi:hypothetical protein